MLVTTSAFAHDHMRPDLDQWFNALRAPDGVKCCSDSDATVVLDSDWEAKDGHYRVFLYGEWITVPDEAVIHDPNLDGQTLVWPFRGYNGTTIRCFMPGTMT